MDKKWEELQARVGSGKAAAVWNMRPLRNYRGLTKLHYVKPEMGHSQVRTIGVVGWESLPLFYLFHKWVHLRIFSNLFRSWTLLFPENYKEFLGVSVFSFLSTTQRKGTVRDCTMWTVLKISWTLFVRILVRIIVGAMHSSIELVKEFLPGGRFFVQKPFALFSGERWG